MSSLLAAPKQQIGPFFVGERPPALTHTFTDADGNAINLSGHTIRFVVVGVDDSDDTGMGGNGTLETAASGIVSYTFSDADMATEGMFRGQFWAGNGTRRYASDIFEYVVVTGTTAPSI
jgi:hypothetical protein